MQNAMIKDKKGRILGVDYGDVRTGLAISDEYGFMANGIGTFRASGMHELCNIIVKHANDYNAVLIVIGNPINMNGTTGPRSEKVRLLVTFLSELTDIPVILYDERCTTMAAHQILNETNTKGKKRKDVIDTLSAQIILQNYLDANR